MFISSTHSQNLGFNQFVRKQTQVLNHTYLLDFLIIFQKQEDIIGNYPK